MKAPTYEDVAGQTADDTRAPDLDTRICYCDECDASGPAMWFDMHENPWTCEVTWTCTLEHPEGCADA